MYAQIKQSLFYFNCMISGIKISVLINRPIRIDIHTPIMPFSFLNLSIGNDTHMYPGADPGFQVRGGTLKKIARSRGRHENFWGISCEKSRFCGKKSYFSNFRGGRTKFWGYFM